MVGVSPFSGEETGSGRGVRHLLGYPIYLLNVIFLYVFYCFGDALVNISNAYYFKTYIINKLVLDISWGWQNARVKGYLFFSFSYEKTKSII